MARVFYQLSESLPSGGVTRMTDIGKIARFKENKIFYSCLIACILCTGYLFLRFSRPRESSVHLPARVAEVDNVISISEEVLMVLEAEMISTDPDEHTELLDLFQGLQERVGKVQFLRGRSERDPQLLDSEDYIEELEGSLMDLSSILEQLLPGWTSRMGQEGEE
jgi:hypothetical protein